jgi:hypothetical protein
MSLKGVPVKAAVVLAASILSMVWVASAARAGGIEEWRLQPSISYFSWEERSGGQRLLVEEGPLYGLDGAVSFDLYRKSLLVQVQGGIFGGEVHYRGQTQMDPNPALSERPVKTSVVYFGTKLATDVGWRFSSPDVAVGPFAGLGYRWWLRSLQDSTALDTGGNPFPVGGYTEDWHELSVRVGLRGQYAPSGKPALFAEAGGKYPVYTRNSADFPGAGNVTLEPEPRWSPFAEAGIRSGRFRTSLSYEGLRYGQSQPVPIGGGLALLQPEADAEIVSLNVGWIFD